MGYVKVRAVAANPRNRRRRKEVEFAVDTGVLYTMMPEDVLKGLGVAPTARRKFKLASGEAREYPIGETYLEVDGVGATSITIFGPKNSSPLIGVTTLEVLGFQVDPLSGKLKPMELLLL